MCLGERGSQVVCGVNPESERSILDSTTLLAGARVMELFAGILLAVMPSIGVMANETMTKKSGYRYAGAMTSGYQTKAIFVRSLNVLA